MTGPVIAGTALRDGVKFIHFSDFTNQLDYADVATELNNKVKSEVLAGVDAKSLVGKKVDFAGAFSLVAPGSVLVVPTPARARVVSESTAAGAVPSDGHGSRALGLVTAPGR